MGNKKDPRKVTITEEPSLISNLLTRGKLLLKNTSDVTIGLHRSATRIDDEGDEVAITFDDCFPLDPSDILDDERSGDAYWGILEAEGSVEVPIWETEV